jgi:predicted PhzF superfamily epimerase YddE/YHI9
MRQLSAVLSAVTDERRYVYSHDPHNATGESIAYAKFFNQAAGISEDPATGTAAGHWRHASSGKDASALSLPRLPSRGTGSAVPATCRSRW